MTPINSKSASIADNLTTASRHLQSIEGLAALAEAIAIGDEATSSQSKLIFCGELAAAIRLLADASDSPLAYGREALAHAEQKRVK